ncbi:MAG: hypothetical protein AAFQ67_03205, partial [Pseudomonadota bacterium]
LIERDRRILALQDENATLKGDFAALQQRYDALIAGQSRPVGVSDAEAAGVEFNFDWRKLQWKQRVKHANDLGANVNSDEEARAFLEMYEDDLRNG